MWNSSTFRKAIYSFLSLTLIWALFPFFVLFAKGLEGVERDSKNQFPSTWKTYPLQQSKVEKVYRVQEEAGEKYIEAFDNQNISLPIFKEIPWKLSEKPVLNWKWRAKALPVNARENDGSKNDSGCSVYVNFGLWGGKTLKYVWSSTLPEGFVFEKKPGEFYVIVKSSGASKMNQWISQTANVAEDYRKYFKSEPANHPSGIGIMSDGNATRSPSGCDYKDFWVSNETSPK